LSLLIEAEATIACEDKINIQSSYDKKSYIRRKEDGNGSNNIEQTKVDSTTMNLLSGQRTTARGDTHADCNMVSLTPFTKKVVSEVEHDDDLDNLLEFGSSRSISSRIRSSTSTFHSKQRAVRRGYETALSQLLAIRHLNSGDGSIVKEIEGLDRTCPVRFGIDFVNTELNVEDAMVGLNERISSNTAEPPCVFLGSHLDIVSAAISTITSAMGYPQISTSTCSVFEDKDNYPLFSRMTPSTRDQARAALNYLSEELDAQQLTLIYSDDPYGNYFYHDIQEAVSERSDYFRLEATSLDLDLSNLPEVMEFVKSKGTGYVFVATMGEYLEDHSIMEQALAHGVAGGNSDVAWFFGDDFLADDPDQWKFDSSNPLIDAYTGTGLLTFNGRGSLRNKVNKNPGRNKYNEFAHQLKALANEHVFDTTNVLEVYLGSMVSQDKEELIEFWRKLLLEDEFLHPDYINYATPYEYESVIMAGLAICNSLDNISDETDMNIVDGENKNHHEANNSSSSALYVSGETFQDELTNTIIDGISGRIVLDPQTGTRLTNSTYITVQNLVPEDFVDYNAQEGGLIHKTKLQRKSTAQLEPIEGSNSDYKGWITFDNSVYNTSGGNIALSETIIVPPSITASTNIVNMKRSSLTEYPSTSPSFSLGEDEIVRIAQGVLSGIPILAAMFLLCWTCRYRNQPIVRASKPVSNASLQNLLAPNTIFSIFSYPVYLIHHENDCDLLYLF